MTKIYGIPGKTSVTINIPFSNGKATLELEFTRGCTDRKNYRPATYRSDNEIEQAIIESSTFFNEMYYLVKVIGEPKPVTDEQLADEPSAEKTEYPEVTSWEEAVKVLKAIPGVKITQLKTPASAEKVAALNGIVFPNYNFE